MLGGCLQLSFSRRWHHLDLSTRNNTETQTKIFCNKGKKKSNLSKKAVTSMKRWASICMRAAAVDVLTQKYLQVAHSVHFSIQPQCSATGSRFVLLKQQEWWQLPFLVGIFFQSVELKVQMTFSVRQRKIIHKISQQNCFKNLSNEHLLQNHSKD